MRVRRQSGRAFRRSMLSLWTVLAAAGSLGTADAGAAEKRADGHATKSVRLPQGAKLELVWIPGGEFWMGCSGGDSCPRSSKPRHQVSVSGFWMGRYEVTQEQWEAVMGRGTWRFPGRQQPAEVTRWELAKEFVRRAGQGLRLPTEAEWEYAARAGSPDPRYGDVEKIAWFGENSAGAHVDADGIFRRRRNAAGFVDSMLAAGCRSHPVGLKQPNAFGLHDLLGNVVEWCEDAYRRDAYVDREGRVTSDPLVQSAGDSLHVVRGGAFPDPAFIIKVSERAFSNLTARMPPSTAGLRVACSDAAPDSP